jgi:hypothetical protein
LVGIDPQWLAALATQESSKESLCGALITMRHQNVDHVPVLIHGAPQISLLAVDSNEDLIQVPGVTPPSLSSLPFPSIIETEFFTPLPDGFIGHDDAARGEKILDIPETQAEAMISPDRIADDLGRETIAGVTRAIALHGTPVSDFMPKLTMPSEGQNEMGGERGCNRAGHFHCRAVWHRRVTPKSIEQHQWPSAHVHRISQ